MFMKIKACLFKKLKPEDYYLDLYLINHTQKQYLQKLIKRIRNFQIGQIQMIFAYLVDVITVNNIIDRKHNITINGFL